MDERIKRSRQQEKRGAKKLGGVVQPRSGAGWKRKGDVRTATSGVEFKRTGKQQITIKAADLRKIEIEASVEGRDTLFGFEVGGRDYWILSDAELQTLRWKAHGDTEGADG